MKLLMSKSSNTDGKLGVLEELGDSLKMVSETACLCHVADELALRSD